MQATVICSICFSRELLEEEAANTGAFLFSEDDEGDGNVADTMNWIVDRLEASDESNSVLLIDDDSDNGNDDNNGESTVI